MITVIIRRVNHEGCSQFVGGLVRVLRATRWRRSFSVRGGRERGLGGGWVIK